MTAEPGRFIRTELKLDVEYTTVRNWWLRDERIVGNPLSLYLYLLSHSVKYEITLERARKALGLGVEAFSSARRRLEDAGFLERVVVRYPKGAVDSTGAKVAGRVRRYDIHVLDPEQPTKASPDGREVKQKVASEIDPPEPVDNFSDDVCAGGVQATEFVNVHEKSWSEQLTGFPLAAKPLAANPFTGFPLLKEENQLKENQSSSSVENSHEPETGFSGDDEDDDVSVVVDSGVEGAVFERLLDAGFEASLREVDARLSLAEIRRRLSLAGVDSGRVDIPAAAAQSLSASARPVGDPSAYVAIAVIREPGRWPWGEAVPQVPLSEKPVKSRCETEGHKYVDEFRSWCARCDQERDGWWVDRDRVALASVAARR